MLDLSALVQFVFIFIDSITMVSSCLHCIIESVDFYVNCSQQFEISQ
uniref:Uncharacterized protein n=1 Tax=Nelumbo nucifera TaxID=4432 RepID=A0A822YVJ9_NELNU|nr:TPA_asm: hypothetical protein HUJ06_006231 [Nelumbo nucifera]